MMYEDETLVHALQPTDGVSETMETDDTQQIGVDVPVTAFSRISHSAPPTAYGVAILYRDILPKLT